MKKSVLLHQWGVGVPDWITAIGEAGSMSLRKRSWLLVFTELALANNFFFALAVTDHFSACSGPVLEEAYREAREGD